jgi:hypothetical protein
VDVPSPRSRLGPAGPAGGALFGGVSKRPESAESIHVCGVDGPSPRIDLAPQQAPPYAGPFSADPWIGARHRLRRAGPRRANNSNKNQILEGELRRLSSSNFCAITCLAILPIRSAVV